MADQNDHKRLWRESAHKRASLITAHIDSEYIYQMIHARPQNRDEYIARLEFCYNYGVTDFPPQVLVELTSYCNFSCAMCPHHSIKRPSMELPEELAKKAVDECIGHGVWYLGFFYNGEPLINYRYLIRMIRYAKAKGLPCVTIVSNVSLMTEEIMKALIDSGLDGLCISFDGTSPEKYDELRHHDYYDVAERIRLIKKVKENLKSSKPFVTMHTIRTDESDKTIDRFIDEWNPYVDAFAILPMSYFHGRNKLAVKYNNSSANWYTCLSDTAKVIPCRQLWQKLIVCSNGEVTPCCIDVDAALSLGNIKDFSLYRIWQGDKFGRLQQLHRQLRHKDIPLCRDCRDFDWCPTPQETLDEQVKA